MFKMISESDNVSYASDEQLSQLIEDTDKFETALSQNAAYLDESGGVYTMVDGVAYDLKKLSYKLDTMNMDTVERISRNV